MSTKSTQLAQKLEIESPKLSVRPSHDLIVKLVSAGTAACIAEVITLPMDCTKIKLQVKYKLYITFVLSSNKHPFLSSFHTSLLLLNIFHLQVEGGGVVSTIRNIAVQDGARGFYRGLVPGLHRQLGFCTIRLGLYEHAKDLYIEVHISH